MWIRTATKPAFYSYYQNENLLTNHQAIVSNVLSTDKNTTFYTGLQRNISSTYNNLLDPSVNKWNIGCEGLPKMSATNNTAKTTEGEKTVP